MPSLNDKTLVFESRFECGNLEIALKVSDTEYNLILMNDTNTSGNTQWFFFKVSNTTQDLKVKFNLINLGKGDSLFNFGMKVLFYSENDEKKSGLAWQRGGEDFLYHQNSMLKPNSNKFFYTVSFSFTFSHTKDTVYFAYSFPYTYTDLMKYLLQLENDPSRNGLFSRKLLCNSIGGNRCDYLTITSSEIPEYMKSRKGVVISARVHPGESVGSWMMHGLIDFLTGPSEEANIIRDNFVIKVIPMLNPDGVINGNYRCNLAGNDLNRKWKQPCKTLQPTIYAAKRLIKNFSKERKLELICDLHGHSRRMNIFMYGCNIVENPSVTRTFPLLLSKISPNFNYKSCSFHIQKSKESTLRVSMFREVEIPFVYTLEASFCGGNGLHYSVNDLTEMGKSVCLALLINSDCQNVPKDLQYSKQDILEELKNNLELLEDNPDTSGSESDPSEDNLDEEILKTVIPKIPKKKKKKKIVKNEKIKHPIRKRESLPARSERVNLSMDKKVELKKCPECGEFDFAGHLCLKKAKKNFSPSPNLYKRSERSLPTSFSSLAVYVNFKGKKVRDQATQTMYVRKIPNSEMKNAQSLSLINGIDRTNSPIKNKIEHFVDTVKLKKVVDYEEISLPSLKYQMVGKSWNVEKSGRFN